MLNTGCAGSSLLRAAFFYLWWMGEHIWCLIRVHVNSTCYLLFFRSEKTLQRVVATIMSIFNNNNNIMNCLPFLMILSYWSVSPTMNLPPIPDSLRLQGWLVESHILMMKGQSLLEFHRPRACTQEGRFAPAGMWVSFYLSLAGPPSCR